MFCAAASQRDKDRAGEIIFETCFMCIFRWCLFNADPHPGNYLFLNGNTVAFLDFGCVKKFQPDFILKWKKLALSVSGGNKKDFREAYMESGLVGNSRGFDFEYQWDMMLYLYESVLSKTPYTFTHEYVKRSYDILTFKNPNKFKMNIPGDWLFVNRLQWGLYSVLAHLNARADWGGIWRRTLELPLEPVKDTSVI